MNTSAAMPPSEAYPPSSQLGPSSMAGKKGFFARLRTEPNAIWLREMRQAARIGRTPWLLFALTLTTALLMSVIGGVASATATTPGVLGEALFQVFFSIAFFVVAIGGPAVAANSIASEREGRTWEAVLLTGLTPQEIARGKFLAAFTTIAIYIVMLAPVGALPFLFGGVTATEVVVAFATLFCFAGLTVAFGLAVSSLMANLRGALVVTLILAICLGPTIYGLAGFGCSFAAHAVWPEVPEAYPIWLPVAYARASLGLDYVLVLFALPTLAMALPAWFLYELTIANLATDSDDRSSGLKRWLFVSTPLFAVGSVSPLLLITDSEACLVFGIAAIVTFAAYLFFVVLLFAGEPPGPSRRVRIHWQRKGTGALTRALGPGLARTSLLLLVLGVLGIVFIAASAAVAIALKTHPKQAVQLAQLGSFAFYILFFHVFTVGLVAWLRARGSAAWTVRMVALLVLFLVAAGPWIVAAIGGVFAHGASEWMIVGAPSPFYVFAMMGVLDKHGVSLDIQLVAGFVAAIAWGVVGLVLLAVAATKASRAVAQHDAAVAQAESALAAEERAARQEAAASFEGAPAS